MSFRMQDLPWREPLTAVWRQQFSALSARVKEQTEAAASTHAENGREIAIEARRLANMRTGPLERVRLNRLATQLWPCRTALPALPPLHLLLAGDGNLGFLAAELPGAGLARGLLVKASEAPYGTIASVALGSTMPHYDDPVDAVVVYLDSQPFLSLDSLLDPVAEAAQIERAGIYIRQLRDGLRQQFHAPVIIATVVAPPQAYIASIDGALPGSELRFIDRINDFIRSGAARGEWQLWDVAALAGGVGRQAWFDPIRIHQAKAMFAVELAYLAADHLCRVLAAMSGKAGRALVLDLDNTLWGGVVADDGIEGIRIGQGSMEGEAYVAFQKFILALRSRGVVLAVCSKNYEETAKRVFREHPDMLLRLEHIAVFQANWSDKASNIKSIAETLKLGLESIVFVDDNPAERARVRQELPLVLVPELDMEAAYYPSLLAASGAFEHLLLNGDDLNRAEAYQAEGLRVDTLQQIGNYEDYLATLNMRMTVAPFDRIGRGRIAQLISKSNQFNVTTRRYSEAQIEALEISSAVLHWQIRLSDAFGDHGMIGVLIVHRTQKIWSIDTWLMSCRVLERGVEQTLMNLLVAEAIKCGVPVLEAEYVRTDRNTLVETLFDRLGFSRIEGAGDDQRKLYRMEVDGFSPFASAITIETPSG